MEIVKKVGRFIVSDERIDRISEKIQSEGFMFLLLILNVVIILRVSIFEKSFFDYAEIALVLVVTSIYVGIKSVRNGATTGSKAIYNICLCFISPMVMSMVFIAEFLDGDNNTFILPVLFIIPLIIMIVVIRVMQYFEHQWQLQNSQDEEGE